MSSGLARTSSSILSGGSVLVLGRSIKNLLRTATRCVNAEGTGSLILSPAPTLRLMSQESCPKCKRPVASTAAPRCVFCGKALKEGFSAWPSESAYGMSEQPKASQDASSFSDDPLDSDERRECLILALICWGSLTAFLCVLMNYLGLTGVFVAVLTFAPLNHSWYSFFRLMVVARTYNFPWGPPRGPISLALTLFQVWRIVRDYPMMRSALLSVFLGGLYMVSVFIWLTKQ